MNYKKYKYKINRFHFNTVLKHNVFIGFFQIKFLDADGWVGLKKSAFVLKLNIFVCKYSYLKKNGLIKYESFHNGNILILHSNDFTLFSLRQDFFIKNNNIIPLYYYLLKRFLFPSNYIHLIESSSKTSIIQS